MKRRIQDFCAGAGLAMLLMTAGFTDPEPAALFGWIAASASLMYIGRAFTFRQEGK